MSNISEMFGLIKHTGFRVGCEFELESVSGHDVNSDLFYNVTEDNSLRNHGWEFITRPLTIDQAVQAHASLWKHPNVKYFNREDACTERCSTHVHVNFTDVDVDKVRTFVRLYALVEPLFFELADPNRQNNIYCVPLSATHMLQNLYNDSIGHMAEMWHKYCAFNVKRITDLGTIEFRHFEATQDTAKFSRWLRMIKALYDFNLNVGVEELPMGESTLYRLYNAVSEYPLTWEDIVERFQAQLANDTLAVVGPDKNLIISRIKLKETA